MFRESDIQPIGLDIGHDSVKMVQIRVTGQSLALVAAASRALEAQNGERGDAALEAAADLLRRGGFSGRRIVAALPREIVHVKNLRLPVIPAAELPAAVKFEARNIFPFDAESAHVDFVAAGEVRQGADVRQEVIVLAAKREDVDDFLERLDRYGLVAASLDAEPCAVYRSVERFIRRRDDDQEVHVLLDVGLRRTQVVIGRGRELSFYKPIDMGGQRLHDAVAQRLGISVSEAKALRRRLGQPATEAGAEADSNKSVRQAVFQATRGPLEELGREVSLCLRYYSVTFRGPGPSRVRLLGGEANDPNVRAVLGAAVSMPVEAAQPLFNVDCAGIQTADFAGARSQWATALGLGLKRTAGRFIPRDGTPRQTRAAMGEVVDLNQAVAETRSAADARGAADGRPAVTEVGRA
jgi:type IV pilus assembly protein PilM